MMVKPLTPNEAAQQNAAQFPDEVIEAVNELLRQRYSPGGVVRFTYPELRDLVMANFEDAGKEITVWQVESNGWFNFEPIFRKNGWQVRCDSPGYNECYDTNWTMSPDNGPNRS